MIRAGWPGVDGSWVRLLRSECRAGGAARAFPHLGDTLPGITGAGAAVIRRGCRDQAALCAWERHSRRMGAGRPGGG